MSTQTESEEGGGPTADKGQNTEAGSLSAEHPETEIPYDSDEFAVVRSSPVEHVREGKIVMTGSKRRMKKEAFEKDKVVGTMYTCHKISDLEEIGFQGENQ